MAQAVQVTEDPVCLHSHMSICKIKSVLSNNRILVILNHDPYLYETCLEMYTFKRITFVKYVGHRINGAATFNEFIVP